MTFILTYKYKRHSRVIYYLDTSLATDGSTVYWEATEIQIQIQIQKTYQCNQIKSLGYQPDYRQQRSLLGGDRNRRHFRSCLGSRQYTFDGMAWNNWASTIRVCALNNTPGFSRVICDVGMDWNNWVSTKNCFFFKLYKWFIFTWQDMTWQLSAIHLSYNT